ncbi:MAG TPA: putative Ig domain-containing protein [Chitinophagaceae bacterium]|nr:putative Ig domain-containing protein [Chitinophagaceae bacterium]
MKFILLSSIVFLSSFPLVTAQNTISLDRGWKFRTGDNFTWADSSFDDSGWKGIGVGKPWEQEGYPGYDGFGWYRIHVMIPSSMKVTSFLKAGLKIDIGEIDDGDQTFLNGRLIGQNAGLTQDIMQGQYNAERIYILPSNDRAIHWDGENVIAVRVFDHGGNGGMWTGKYDINPLGLPDIVHIDYQDDPFSFPGRRTVKKHLILECTARGITLSGTLQVRVTNPLNNQEVWSRTIPVLFSGAHPFNYTYTVTLPESQSYQAMYNFKEKRTGKSITASEIIPYILTPRPSAKPRINGASIVGLRPGNPLLFKIPVTGVSPMAYHALHLPAGLHLNTVTGILSGTLDKKGTYWLRIIAHNKMGNDSETLQLVVGNQIALTPAMGWNSWNCWGLSVSDAKVRASADAMVKKGLINHGWTYINIDDGWEKGRDSGGRILPNAKFPDMKALATFIHRAGLKMGIYSSPGPKTCGGFTGSYQHEQQDAETYAGWGIDYLKYDWCSYGQIYPHPDLAEMQKPYQVMRDALDHVHRDILFSLCQYGMGDVWKWGGEIGGNSWRTTGDINDTWARMSSIGFRQDKCAPFAKPGNWNDPDMLVVGRVGWGPTLHNSHLTPDEQYTHISLWCLLSAPLLIGCDMSRLDAFTLNLLSNDEVLAVDQDPLGKEAMPVYRNGNIQVWAKPLADGSEAVGIFNLGPSMAKGSLRASDLHMGGLITVRDLWRQQNLGTFNQVYSANIPSHGVVLLKVREAHH